MGRRLNKNLILISSVTISIILLFSLVVISACSVDMLDYIGGKIALDDFHMIYCPGGTFPTGTDDSGEDTVDPFYIAETEVTYQLWSVVYNWSTSNGYTFANIGRMGGWAQKMTTQFCIL